jgi:hypothetical protein
MTQLSAVQTACGADNRCQWVSPWEHNPYETFVQPDPAKFSIRRHRTLTDTFYYLDGSTRIEAAGANTPELCADACLK